MTRGFTSIIEPAITPAFFRFKYRLLMAETMLGFAFAISVKLVRALLINVLEYWR